MQEDPAVEIALVPASSNPMGSHITCDCCVQRSCSAKLYALRTGCHSGQREQRLSRPSHDPLKKNRQSRSVKKAYCHLQYTQVLDLHVFVSISIRCFLLLQTDCTNSTGNGAAAEALNGAVEALDYMYTCRATWHFRLVTSVSECLPSYPWRPTLKHHAQVFFSSCLLDQQFDLFGDREFAAACVRVRVCLLSSC